MSSDGILSKDGSHAVLGSLAACAEPVPQTVYGTIEIETEESKSTSIQCCFNDRSVTVVLEPQSFPCLGQSPLVGNL